MKSVTQKVGGANAVTYVGKGKLEEIKQYIKDEDDAERPVGMVIFDDEITPVQQRNLENILRVPVMDRTEVICGL